MDSSFEIMAVKVLRSWYSISKRLFVAWPTRLWKVCGPRLVGQREECGIRLLPIHGKWSIAAYEHSQTVVDVSRLAGIEGDHHCYLYILI